MQRFWQKRPQWWKKLLALFNTTEKDYLISLIFIYAALFFYQYIFHDNYFYSLQNKGLHYIIVHLLCMPLAYSFILNKILSKGDSNKKNKKDDYSEMQQAGFIALFFTPIIVIFIVIKKIREHYLK